MTPAILDFIFILFCVAAFLWLVGQGLSFI